MNNVNDIASGKLLCFYIHCLVSKIKENPANFFAHMRDITDINIYMYLAKIFILLKMVIPLYGH